ncbi:hypothetical protein JCM9533A_58310 [Catenuloplanes niger JCM 9533]
MRGFRMRHSGQRKIILFVVERATGLVVRRGRVGVVEAAGGARPVSGGIVLSHSPRLGKAQMRKPIQSLARMMADRTRERYEILMIALVVCVMHLPVVIS